MLLKNHFSLVHVAFLDFGQKLKKTLHAFADFVFGGRRLIDWC